MADPNESFIQRFHCTPKYTLTTRNAITIVVIRTGPNISQQPARKKVHHNSLWTAKKNQNKLELLQPVIRKPNKEGETLKQA